jgi:Ca2+-binding EF-hand superfamily protein
MSTDDELLQTFKEFDQDGDGYITAVEFKLAMTARGEGVTGDEIDSILDNTDGDQDRLISFAEFVQAWNG